MDRIAVLIPCFNEALSVKKVIADWKRELPDAKIYVYDNNSTDGTAEAAREAGAVVRHEHRQGKGSVIRSMFQDIDAECYIMVDGDDTYPSARIGRIEDQTSPDFKQVMSDLVEDLNTQMNAPDNMLKDVMSGSKNVDIHDVMTGCRALSYRFVKSFPVLSQGFEIETEMTIHAVDKNMRIMNHVVNYRERPDGSESKLRTIPDGLKVLKTIFHLFCDYRPMFFFSLAAVFLLVISGAMFVPVLGEYFETGLVRRFPTLIVCGFGAVSAIISFFAGVILQTIKNNERREFEFRLHQVSEWRKSDIRQNHAGE